MKKNLSIIILFIFFGCSSSDRGELVGVKGKKFFPDKPSGMVLIPSGSFLMGMSDEDIVGLQNAPISTVSVKAFYMDETEITNGFQIIIGQMVGNHLRHHRRDFAEYFAAFLDK